MINGNMDSAGRVWKWVIMPNPYTTDYDSYATDDDSDAREAILDAAEMLLWNDARPGESRSLRVTMRAEGGHQ